MYKVNLQHNNLNRWHADHIGRNGDWKLTYVLLATRSAAGSDSENSQDAQN